MLVKLGTHAGRNDSRRNPPLASSLKQIENTKMDVIRILFKDGVGMSGIFLKLTVQPFNFSLRNVLQYSG